MQLYINGKGMGDITTTESQVASGTAHTNLIFGAGSLYSLVDDYWDMHIDDFAIWQSHYLTSDEVIYIINKGKYTTSKS